MVSLGAHNNKVIWTINLTIMSDITGATAFCGSDCLFVDFAAFGLNWGFNAYTWSRLIWKRKKILQINLLYYIQETIP